MNRLAGKVAFITGGGSGIARAAALVFAREGAKVVVAEIDAALGAVTADAVRAEGGDAIAVHTDVTDEASVQAAIAAAVARRGRLDILFNCAGGSLNADSQVTDVDLAVWDRTMALDVRGAMLVCRHGIPELVKAGGGSVVNMSSGAALRGSSPKHVYTAAKGAILSFTRALAGSYAKDNVRANAICAGRILTERILNNYGTAEAPGPVADRQDAAGRVRDYPFWVGRPEDIANIALFLASDESRMITGATIPADGGRSAY
ncbi:MAG: SDR family NAD(P)-dependent oxidoreductase [bacterium]|jgi:NAD(P)-dependent dehydrogenase (short-subunit alcohol dehydrogenase family)|nr:SDR family oxidoreductase [Betaproteobacteria bacterium]